MKTAWAAPPAVWMAWQAAVQAACAAEASAGGRAAGASGNATISGNGPGFQQGGGSSDGVEGGGGGKGRGTGVKSANSSTSDATERASSAKNAETISTVEPDVPDSMRGQSFSYRITARVTIEPNGRHSAVITSGSGNDAIDRAVLSALSRYRWRPASRDGKPVQSTQSVVVNFNNK